MPSPVQKDFDLPKVQQMTEPLSVKVFKKAGHRKQPVTLYAGPNSAPGCGWTRAEVIQLENHVLGLPDGGYGEYEAHLTDNSNPPMALRYEFAWFEPRPQQAPQQQPAVTVGAQPIQPMGQQVQMSAMPVAHIVAPSNGAAAPAAAAPAAVQPLQVQSAPQPVQQMPFGQQPQQWGPQQWGPPAHQQNPEWVWGQKYPGAPYDWIRVAPEPSSRRRPSFEDDRGFRRGGGFEDDEQAKKVRDLEEKLATAEKARIESEHRAELEKLQREQKEREVAQQAKLDAMMEEMRKMREVQAAPRQDGPSLEMEKMRIEHERMKAELERDREKQRFEAQLAQEKAERERREERDRHEREIAERDRHAAEEKTNQRFEMMQREMRDVLAASQNRADPVIEMMKENARNQIEAARIQAEAQKEIARNQQAQVERMAQFTMRPAELLDIVSRNRESVGGIAKEMTEAFTGLVGMYRQMGQHALEQAGGGGPGPIASMIQQGLENAKGVADQYINAMRENKTVEARAGAEKAKAEAQARAAEANARAAQAQAEAYKANAQAAQAQAQQRGFAGVPPVAQAAGGGNGSAPRQAPPPPPQQQQRAPQPPPPQQQAAPQPQAQPQQQAPNLRVVPQTPEQETQAARDSQAKTDAVVQDPTVLNERAPTEEEFFGAAWSEIKKLRKGVADGHLTPEQTADAIIQGVSIAEQQQLVIPAFILFRDSRWADLLDALIPQATIDYKRKAIEHLIVRLEGPPEEGEEEEDEPETEPSPPIN